MRALLFFTIFTIRFWFVSTKAVIILALAKATSRMSLKINAICNFQTMKTAVELLLMFFVFFFNFIYLFFWLLLKFFFGGYSRKFLRRQCKIQFSRGNLREQKVLESAFSSFQGALKSKILATMVPPPGHIGYITNNKPLVLSYWELERMLSTTIVFSFNGLIWKIWYPLIALFFQVSFMIMKIS